ncbi:MAG TPA: G1 family glutamic endopeptidase, partial [Solirubrobacteraceae bacterium]|nr:G1 family glutamic endopeptidase [Solirubrobacteraceae bacterium]
MATLGLAGPAFAGATGSPSFAGYIDATSLGHWTISGTIVVPKVTCTTGETREITPSVGVESASLPSHAGLIIGCDAGKVTYTPVIELNGSEAHYNTQIRPNDKITLKVT